MKLRFISAAVLSVIAVTLTGCSASNGNSAYRLASVWDRFTVGPDLAAALGALAGRPILLIDDLADSRWTATVAARVLRQNGASAVLPFTLALRT